MLWTLHCCLVPLAAQTPCDAVQAWEKLIEAKGGREKLEGIRTFYFRERGSAGRDIRTLYAMPRLFWQWDDSHTPMFGVTVSQADLDRGTTASLNVSSQFKPVLEKSTMPTKLVGVDDRLAAYLIETKWLKPVPVGCKIGEEKQGTVVLLEAEAQGARLVYHLDATTYLPLRLSVPEGSLTWEHYLEDYQRVGGIMLPSRRREIFGSLVPVNLTVSYEINPAYDSELWKRDPSVEAGPDAWRLK
jgi:hypothetical protein